MPLPSAQRRSCARTGGCVRNYESGPRCAILCATLMDCLSRLCRSEACACLGMCLSRYGGLQGLIIVVVEKHLTVMVRIYDRVIGYLSRKVILRE